MWLTEMSDINRNDLDGEFGGYFELSLPDYGDPYPTPYIKYQSARAALRAAIEASNLTHVKLPSYVCDAVIQAAIDSGRTISFYDLNAELLPDLVEDLSENTWLLYVNYFGLCDNQIRSLLRRYPGKRLLIDNTQAFFSCPIRQCVTIYSPRKFVGLPDGGVLHAAHLDVRKPSLEDEGSMERIAHLIIRASEGARAGYSSFLTASRSLENTTPLMMSKVTRRLLSSIDLNVVRERRRANFKLLSEAFDTVNELSWHLDDEAVPLCYPLVLNKDTAPIRNRLADLNIFVPTYWEDARHRIRSDGVEAALLHRCLAIPCDQRYSEQQIVEMIKIIEMEIYR